MDYIQQVISFIKEYWDVIVGIVGIFSFVVTICSVYKKHGYKLGYLEDTSLPLLIDYDIKKDLRIIYKGKTITRLKGKTFRIPFISEKDSKGILYAIKKNVDFLALSYVRDEQDVLEVTDMLIENEDNHINIIAKIENESAIEYLDDILRVSDGVMVARGDLGIELSMEKLPYYQKTILKSII